MFTYNDPPWVDAEVMRKGALDYVDDVEQGNMQDFGHKRLVFVSSGELVSFCGPSGEGQLASDVIQRAIQDKMSKIDNLTTPTKEWIAVVDAMLGQMNMWLVNWGLWAGSLPSKSEVFHPATIEAQRLNLFTDPNAALCPLKAKEITTVMERPLMLERPPNPMVLDPEQL